MKALILLLASCCPTLYAQAPPDNSGQTSDGKVWMWAPGTSVTVYLDPAYFSPGSAVSQAVQNGFTADQNAINNGVVYTFLYADFIPILTQNTELVTGATFQNPLQYGDSDMQVTPGQTYDPVNNVVVQFAISDIDSGNVAVLQSTAAHEALHPDGFGDCYYSCTLDSSLMGLIHTQNPVPGPTDNDLETFNDIDDTYAYGGCGDNPCGCGY